LLRVLGYVEGVGYSGRDAPRRNYTNDPYYTDGLRVVLIVGEDRSALTGLELLPWEWPSGQIAGSPPADPFPEDVPEPALSTSSTGQGHPLSW